MSNPIGAFLSRPFPTQTSQPQQQTAAQILAGRVSNLKGLMNKVKAASNPYQAIADLANSNPKVKEILMDIHAHGNDPEKALSAKISEMGLNANDVLGLFS